jgi:uncharacterized Zn finger protein
MIIPNSNFGSTTAEVTREARQWWVERWLELLDSYRFKKRLERARIYAREGNIVSIEFIEARAIARVQGTEVEPYEVSLYLDVFSDEDWEYVIAGLAEKAIFSAQLLAGEMPDNIEKIFINNGLNLFPFSLIDVHSECSCPDRANPCKHIGAVYYQLADRFSEDPFVIFQLRGRSKTQILDALRELRRHNLSQSKTEADPSEKKTKKNKKTTKKNVKSTATNLDRLSVDLEKFWQYKRPLEPSLLNLTPPTENKTILDLLGIIPLPTTEATALRQYLSQIYQAAETTALSD